MTEIKRLATKPLPTTDTVSMATGQEPPSWPVIVHDTLSHTEYATILRQKKFKVRVSESIVRGSVIFPQSGVAFMVIPLARATTTVETGLTELTDELIERLDQLTKVHRNCYALCEARLHWATERNVFSLIQRRYLFSKLHMIPVHSPNEAIHSMLTIAKALCRPICGVLSERLDKVFTETLARDTMPAALACIGLNNHECQVIQDGLGSLTRLAAATRDDLLNCSVDSQTVARILTFFNDPQEKHEGSGSITSNQCSIAEQTDS